ncbi:hypothetical protein [Bacillus cereus]
MENIIPNEVESITFTNKPIPVPYNYRIVYKITQIALIVYICSGRKACSLIKIHMISTALNSKERFDNLLNYVIYNEQAIDLVRFDPSINRAVDFALAEGILLRQKNGLFKLPIKGKGYIEHIINDTSMFIFERNQLKQLGSNLTEDKIDRLISIWSDIDV